MQCLLLVCWMAGCQTGGVGWKGNERSKAGLLWEMDGASKAVDTYNQQPHAIWMNEMLQLKGKSMAGCRENGLSACTVSAQPVYSIVFLSNWTKDHHKWIALLWAIEEEAILLQCVSTSWSMHASMCDVIKPWACKYGHTASGGLQIPSFISLSLYLQFVQNRMN